MENVQQYCNLMEQTDPVQPQLHVMASLSTSDALAEPSVSSTILSAANGTATARFSALNLLLLVPRLVYKAGHLALSTVPEQLGILGRDMAQTGISEGSMRDAVNGAVAGPGATIGQGIEGSVAEATVMAQDAVQADGDASSFVISNVRNLGSILSYITSKWSFSCLTVVSTAAST